MRTIGTVKEFKTAKYYDPTQGLSLTRTEQPGIVSSFSSVEYSNSAVFACSITFPYPANVGCLFEMGGTSAGCFAGLRANSSVTVFRIRGGNGTTNLANSDFNCCVADITDYPRDNEPHQLVWEMNPAAGNIRVWIDGDLKANSFTTGGVMGFASTAWCGADDGGYMRTDGGGTVPTGEPSSTWLGADIGGGLKVYTGNQVVTAVPKKLNSGVWDLDKVNDWNLRPLILTDNHFPTPTDLYYSYSATSTNNCTISRDLTTNSPFNNTPLKMSITGNDPYIGSYNSAPYNLAQTSVGEVWEVTVWAKGDGVANSMEIFIFEASSAGGYITHSSATFFITETWKRYRHTKTIVNGSTAWVQFRLDGSWTAGQDIWFDGAQIRRIG